MLNWGRVGQQFGSVSPSIASCPNWQETAWVRVERGLANPLQRLKTFKTEVWRSLADFDGST
jgi:hypothetical protein